MNTQINHSISKTLLLPLYFRAEDARRSKPFLNDPYAIEILSHFKDIPSDLLKSRKSRAGCIARARFLDRRVKEFIKNNPNPVIVNIACGLDTRSLRCYDEKAIFYDTDLPEVIELRKQIIPDKSIVLAGDVLDKDFFQQFTKHENAQFCFVSEGLFMYFDKKELHGLLENMQNACSGTLLADFNFGDYWEKNQHKHDLNKSFKESNAKFKTSFDSIADLKTNFPRFEVETNKPYNDKEFNDIFGWGRFLFMLAPKRLVWAMQLLKINF